jgi:hypothetical protein
MNTDSNHPDPATSRAEVIESIKREYGDVTFYDSTTVIAGGKKHQVPDGTVFVSAKAEWIVGPRGGIYKGWYSPGSGRFYREYYKCITMPQLVSRCIRSEHGMFIDAMQIRPLLT